MSLFGGPTKKERMIDGLLNIKDDQELFDSLTTLQNEIGVAFNTKVIAIASIKNDLLTAAFSKGFADAFALNKSNCLIIDANMYDPSLEKLLGEGNLDSKKPEKKDGYEIKELSEGVSAIYLEKQIYPSEVFKSGLIQKIVEEQKESFEHIVIITPSIKEHKEIVLLKEIIQAVILISQRNVTLKKNIYDASAFLVENELPLAKAVVLK